MLVGPPPWSSCGFSRTGNGLTELDLNGVFFFFFFGVN